MHCRLGARTHLLLYGTADPPKVLSEGVGGIGGAPRQVVVESRLLAQRLTCLDFARLFAFGLPDLVHHGKHFFDTLSRHEQDPVVVAENDVVAAYQVGPELCRVSASDSRLSSRTGPSGQLP